MKKILLLLCAFGALLTSCSDKTPAPTIEVLEGTEILDFSNAEGSKVVKFSANGAWTAEVTTGAEWITLSATSGNAGENELTVSVSANGYESRSGAILLANGAATAQVTVNQTQENALIVDATEKVFDAVGGTFGVAVETNLVVSVSINAEWISQAEPTAVRGLEQIVYNFVVAENESTSERTAVITFSAEGVEPKSCTVLQAGSVRTPDQIPATQIWYTTSDDAVVAPVADAQFGAALVDNTYKNGLGVINFEAGINAISAGAFQGLTTLVSIVIPASVAEIGASAFEGCTSLGAVYLSSLIPPTLGADAFKNNALAAPAVPEEPTPEEPTPAEPTNEEGTEVVEPEAPIYRTIYVPNAAVVAYKNAEGWSHYANNIKGYDQETLPGFGEGNGVLE